ncbi:MAG: SAM-dependent methyltransferase [Gemmatimonadota bacterium]|nr:SAM-dependent methyltransferase [Gemmatimonadota bacterium]
MTQPNGRIESISDTARWVAVYRAMENDRPDAHFRDPFARRLAGERGEQIMRAMPWGKWMAWAMIVRTAVFDEMILTQIRAGVDTVLNLAAGLDTRAYRLPLPPTLRWVDVDLPAMIEYKREQLAGERPACQLESVALDLADASGRRALFQRVGAQGARVLVVSEGLLIYLPRQEVETLAGDLHAQPTFSHWLSDLASPLLLQWMQKRMRQALAEGKAAFQFAPAEGPAFFEPFCWKLAEARWSLEEARRLHREMPAAWLMRLLSYLRGAKEREAGKRMSSIILLERV